MPEGGRGPRGLRSEVVNNIRIDWDVPIVMDDGLILRANVYRPDDETGRFPVILSHGPYGKDLAWQDGYPTVWKVFSEGHPEAVAGSTNVHQSWEVLDPEKWVPDGYVLVRVDSRGAGRSPGRIDHWSPRETKDFYDCIEWAGVQNWSNGKVGLSGISYYAVNQWQVAAMKPPHLAAICPWEGFNDFYRELSHHGGIQTSFMAHWYDLQIKIIQHGLGKRGFKSRVNGELASGPGELTDAELAKNRADLAADYTTHALDDDFYRARTPDLSQIDVPLLSCANWGGQPLHPRGNYMGYMNARSKQKWLECHGLEHWTHFYTPYGQALQKQFFDYFLKGAKNGWARRPKVMLQVRSPGEKFVARGENEWPLKRTKWTKAYLDAGSATLDRKAPAKAAKVAYKGQSSDGVTFMLPPAAEDTELTGPFAAKLFVSSSTADADLFLVVRLFSPDMTEVTFKGTVDPHTPIAQGWLRASHRKLDKKKSKPWQPWHTHDEKQPLTPDRVYELDVEIHPTCIVVPAGYRLALTVRGKDYVWPGAKDTADQVRLSNFAKPLTGCGPFLHDIEDDRPAKVYDGTVTIHTGGKRASYLLLPVIPGRRK
ncbi:MAG: CocE/NonD family hydrolase [Alphaproteobacteria bacterium]